MFLLDTNVVIAVMNEKDRLASARMDAELVRGTPILISSIVLFELRFGVEKSLHRERNEAVLKRFLSMPILLSPFEREDAEHAGHIRAALARRGTPIGPYDLLIAAQARRREAILVTDNMREFARVPDLRVENWALPS